MNVPIRSDQELELMRKSGEISAKALRAALEAVREGVSLPEIEEVAREKIRSLGGEESFKTVDDYFWATCITVNDEVVHGKPDRPIVLKKGDKVSIDLGTVYKGWHTDCAWSVMVGPSTDAQDKFLAVGEEALWKGIKQAHEGMKIGDIACAIQETVEGGGYQVVRALVGHGVGKELHEDPEIPGFGEKGTGLGLKSGMTLAIEVIYTAGTRTVVLEEDGWTISTEDGRLGGLFEMSVIVGLEKAEVLTDWRKV